MALTSILYVPQSTKKFHFPFIIPKFLKKWKNFEQNPLEFTN